MSSTPILLILGSGSNIGRGVGDAFAAKDYNLALVSRSISEETSTATELHIQADLSDPSVVPSIFAKVKDTFGSPPSVVVYNAFSRTINDPETPLHISLPQLTHDMAVNTYTPLSAASTFISSHSHGSPLKTFIFTGNMLNEIANPPVLGFGMGKSATAHMISLAALVYGESGKGFRFYYADERLPDGMPAMRARSGHAAGKFYTWLAEQETQGP